MHTAGCMTSCTSRNGGGADLVSLSEGRVGPRDHGSALRASLSLPRPQGTDTYLQRGARVCRSGPHAEEMEAGRLAEVRELVGAGGGGVAERPASAVLGGEQVHRASEVEAQPLHSDEVGTGTVTAPTDSERAVIPQPASGPEEEAESGLPNTVGGDNDSPREVTTDATHAARAPQGATLDLSSRRIRGVEELKQCLCHGSNRLGGCMLSCQTATAPEDHEAKPTKAPLRQA